MHTRIDNLYRLIETWGYPRAGTDWLRRHRVWFIVILACLAWAAFVLVGWAAIAVLTWFFDSVIGAD
jgi:hypothetical protein